MLINVLFQQFQSLFSQLSVYVVNEHSKLIQCEIHDSFEQIVRSITEHRRYFEISIGKHQNKLPFDCNISRVESKVRTFVEEFWY